MVGVDRRGTLGLFAGLPGTGKTTYLALLYLTISGNRSTDLRLGGYKDDREYANTIATRLMACEESIHTETSEHRRVALSLEVGEERRPGMLEIPDLSGETWEDAVYDRTWPGWVDDAASAACGTLIFVHVVEFDAAASIATTQTALRVLGENENHRASDAEATSSSGARERPSRPTQVQIVDLLQLICEERSPRPARAAIMLSAWDLTDQTLTPAQWLATNAPLVDQYMRANRPWLCASVWGVSAQGGDFTDRAQRASLLDQDAIDRARIWDGDKQSCPVETPMLWVMRSGRS